MAHNVRHSSRLKTKEKTKEDKKMWNDAYNAFQTMKDLEDELNSITQDTRKPTELFDATDTGGRKLYNRDTKSKNNMQKKVAQANELKQAKSSTNKNNLKELRIVLNKLDIQDGKPVCSLKRNQKEQPSQELSEDSDEESRSEDEYDPENDDEDLESDESEDEENSDKSDVSAEKIELDEDEEEVPSEAPFQQRVLRAGETFEPHACSEFHFKSEEYFDKQRSMKTSNKTLGRLKHSMLKPEQVKKLLAKQDHVSEEHKDAIERLCETCYNAFPLWDFILEEGFNILLYGLGSKRKIINNYRTTVSEHPGVIINGFFPSLTLKEIADAVIVDLLEMNPLTDVNESFKIIEETMKSNPNDRLFLFIHNIDGPTLRTDKAQDFLSRLAAIPNVHMVASVDHNDAPILWDNVKRYRFNFYWWDATTFLPYQEETSYESSLLVQHSGVLALSSLQSVFASLTDRAKEIFNVLLQYQMEHGFTSHYQGMSFKRLYNDTKEKFLVTSDATLRAQLVEFIDHNLIKQSRSADGTEYLKIPLQKDVLQQFLDEGAK